MDLSFSRFERVAPIEPTPAELAATIAVAGVIASQAIAQGGPLRSRDGAFNGSMAAALVRWKEE